MNKLILALAICSALVACSKDDTAAVTEPAAPADTAAAVAQDAIASTDSVADANTDGLPPECEAYLARVDACFANANSSDIDARTKAEMKARFDAAREQWQGFPRAELTAACQMSNSGFTSAAAALKCE